MKGLEMKAIIEVSAKDLISYQASIDEIRDWFQQALRHSVDTWDGGLTFLDSVELEIREI